MSKSGSKATRAESEHKLFLKISERSLREAQRIAIREDARFGLKPVIVEHKPARRSGKAPRSD